MVVYGKQSLGVSVIHLIQCNAIQSVANMPKFSERTDFFLGFKVKCNVNIVYLLNISMLALTL